MSSKGFFLICLLLSYVAADAQERSLTVTADPEPGTLLQFIQGDTITIDFSLTYSGLFPKNIFLADTQFGFREPSDSLRVFPATYNVTVIAEAEGSSGTTTGRIWLAPDTQKIKAFLEQLTEKPRELLFVIYFVVSNADSPLEFEFFLGQIPLVYPTETAVSPMSWGQVKTQY